MSRMSELMAKRREARHAQASASVAAILHDAGRLGVDITLVGSLAKGDFRVHSDVDLLVRGAINLKRRLLIERLVANAMRASDIPYDLLFEDDLGEDRVWELLHDIV